jgi:hypothetical protein
MLDLALAHWRLILEAVSVLASLGAGGYLHHRFGKSTVKAALAVKEAFADKAGA